MSEKPGYSEISPHDAYKLMRTTSIVVVDVREPYEYEAGHIRGAINIPLGRIVPGRVLPELPDMTKPVLVYCRSGRRSGVAGRTMANTGYADVRNFGGVIHWPYGLVRED